MVASRNGSPPWDHHLLLGVGKERFVRPAASPVDCKSPGSVAAYCVEAIFGEMEHLEQEELWVLLLNNKNRLTHEVLLYRGTQTSCHVRVAEVFREAIRYGAAAIIIAHCHPSGDPTPSPEDQQITRQAIDAGGLLDVKVLDHLVFGHARWVSMRERGLGF